MSKDEANPDHYTAATVETWDLVPQWAVENRWDPRVVFHLGSAMKYIQRHNLKGTPVADLNKAARFLEKAAALLGETIPRMATSRIGKVTSVGNGWAFVHFDGKHACSIPVEFSFWPVGQPPEADQIVDAFFCENQLVSVAPVVNNDQKVPRR